MTGLIVGFDDVEETLLVQWSVAELLECLFEQVLRVVVLQLVRSEFEHRWDSGVVVLHPLVEVSDDWLDVAVGNLGFDCLSSPSDLFDSILFQR